MCETLKDNPYDYMADIWSLGKCSISCHYNGVALSCFCCVSFSMFTHIN